MANVVSVGLDAGLVERALTGGARPAMCWQARDGEAVLRSLERGVPELVVLGGDAGVAADVAETLLDEPLLLSTTIVAWSVHGSLAETSRLVALGVLVIAGDLPALGTACQEALDAREGRTIRVDPPTEVRAARSDELDLHGRRVIVADDDPAITWFFADRLRAEGCDVTETQDGAAALDAARRTVPDVVVSDIRMPRMDGVRLSRALRADPVLADVPIVLLSWKDDWLQDARDVGVDASGYLRKRCAPEEIPARIREVLAPHVRLERRVREPGAMRGRLDGTAPHRLLRLACAMRVDAGFTVRCHPHAYEIQIRDGAPRGALRVSSDGATVRGIDALTSFLDERSGRFTLTTGHAPVEAELEGSLHQQVAAHVARSRRTSEMPVKPVRPSAPEAVTNSPPIEAPRPAFIAAVPLPIVAPVAPAVAPPIAAPLAPLAPVPLPMAPPVVTAPPPPPPVRAPEPIARTVPIAQPQGRANVAPFTRPAAERTTPIPQRTRRSSDRPAAVVAGLPGRTRAIPLRWVGIAAVAALGILLGAGARALRQAEVPAPTPMKTTSR
ncbi:MAG TPA: response regulator [Polyangiaceae bacterium]